MMCNGEGNEIDRAEAISDREEIMNRAVRLILGRDPAPEEYAQIKDMISAYTGEEYRLALASEEFTPRGADLRNCLETVKSDVIRLRASFDRLMRVWNDDVDYLLTPRDVKELGRRAFAEGLRAGRSAREIYQDLPSMLVSMERMVDERLNRMGVDPGGRTNLWKSRFGSAQYQLVFWAVHVLAVFRGKDALKGSDQGAAAELARIFLSLAGEDPEAIDLMKPVKAAIREIRTNPVFFD